jgi:hypothetical protein
MRRGAEANHLGRHAHGLVINVRSAVLEGDADSHDGIAQRSQTVAVDGRRIAVRRTIAPNGRAESLPVLTTGGISFKGRRLPGSFQESAGNR